MGRERKVQVNLSLVRAEKGRKGIRLKKGKEGEIHQYSGNEEEYPRPYTERRFEKRERQGEKKLSKDNDWGVTPLCPSH